MKKKLYGIYVLFLGLQVKTFRKKDIAFQMKFVQAATKYLSMVLIITAFTIACSTQAIPIISDDEPQEERGNWTAGLVTETVEDTLVSTTTPTNNVILNDEGIPITIKESEIINPSFEEPLIDTPVRALDSLSGWLIEKGNVAIVGDSPGWYPPPKGIQSLSLSSGGKVTQEIKTVTGREYLLSVSSLASIGCPEEERKLAIYWNNAERIVVDLKEESWQKFEITLESSLTDNALSFETKSSGQCGSGIDNIKVTYEDDGIVDSISIDETDSVESLKLELQQLLDDLRRDPQSIPTPTIEPIPTPTPISVLPEPTPLFTLEPTPTVGPTPTPTPTPAPTSKYSTSSAIQTALDDMIYTSGPTVAVDSTVSFTSTVGAKVEPTTIQVWVTSGDSGAILSDATYDPSVCSTEKPIVIFRKPRDPGYRYTNTSTEINWPYCINGDTTNTTITVPYETATTWTWNADTGEFIFQGNKAVGNNLEYIKPIPGINSYIIVALSSEGLMSRKVEVR